MENKSFWILRSFQYYDYDRIITNFLIVSVVNWENHKQFAKKTIKCTIYANVIKGKMKFCKNFCQNPRILSISLIWYCNIYYSISVNVTQTEIALFRRDWFLWANDLLPLFFSPLLICYSKIFLIMSICRNFSNIFQQMGKIFEVDFVIES